VIRSAGRRPGLSHGGGGQTNGGGGKSVDAADVAKEKLPLGGINSEKEKAKRK